jgi:dynein light intermediate chain 2
MDREMMDPLLIPLVILGTKYDLFQDYDPEMRKVICRTLRFIAHRSGAHLLFFTTKQETLLGKMRSMVSHLIFATPLSKTCQTDHSKPLLITAGQDSFQQIGSPPLAEGDIGRVMAKTPTDLWKHAFTAKFPQQNSADPSMVADPAKDRQFAEPAVDAMRQQKDQELERYRRESERKAKESVNKSLAEGFVY